MFLALLAVTCLTLVLVVALLVRRPKPAEPALDPRLQGLLGSDLPGQLARKAWSACCARSSPSYARRLPKLRKGTTPVTTRAERRYAAS